jgi:hypothetical protein
MSPAGEVVLTIAPQRLPRIRTPGDRYVRL